MTGDRLLWGFPTVIKQTRCKMVCFDLGMHRRRARLVQLPPPILARLPTRPQTADELRLVYHEERGRQAARACNVYVGAGRNAMRSVRETAKCAGTGRMRERGLRAT